MAITIAYDETRDSPEVSISRNEVKVMRKLICDWVDAITLAKELLGYWEGVVFNPPDEYSSAYFDSASETLYNVFADDVDIKRWHDDTKDEKAILKVAYKTPEGGGDYETIPNGNGGDVVFVTEALQAASEFSTLDRKGLYLGLGDDAKKLDEANLEAPAFVNRMIEWQYTLHHVLTLPDAYFDLVGKVNDDAIYSRALNKTFPAQTLLCGNPFTRREISWSGVSAWEVTFRFLYKNNGTLAVPKGWNHFPDTENANADGIPFVPITNFEEDIIPIYQLGDFTGIVR